MTRAELVSERPNGVSEDVHFPESIARVVIAGFSREGDLVLDPFAGFGTTAVVAASMGRRAVAVELLEDRAAIIRRRIGSRDGASVVVGDARQLSRLVAGPVDLCLTSPPYMGKVDHPENPLTGYRTRDGDYPTYLGELEDVFRQVAVLLRPGGHLIVNAADVVHEGGVTPLADDLRVRIGRHLAFREEIAISWDVPPPSVENDRLLVFARDGPSALRTPPMTSHTKPAR
ncbi:MAG TPA: DNA methyltransferase [Patescibacteria group bacterium]|nr:DNA methyltransferase [Patescibacteria group bacterium]